MALVLVESRKTTASHQAPNICGSSAKHILGVGWRHGGMTVSFGRRKRLSGVCGWIELDFR